MISFQTWGERGGEGICVGMCKTETGDEKETWVRGGAEVLGWRWGDNYSPLGHCRGQDPSQGSWYPGILTLAGPVQPVDRLCGWVGLCQSEMAWI